jgi:hypothetical protein
MHYQMIYGLITIIFSLINAFDYNYVADVLPNMSSIEDNFNHIEEGYFRFWQTTDCLSILYKTSPFNMSYGCYLQNPNAPYGLMLFPPHHDEVIDKYYGFPLLDENNFTGTWHLKSEDVIILLGMTPPKCKYFSFSNYLYSRYLPPDWKPSPTLQGYDLACPDGATADRCEFFASLDDSLNLDRGLNLNPDIFNTSFALIISANYDAMEAARQGLIEAGVDYSLISNYSYPGTELNLGVNTTDDTFITIMRTAFYENQEEADDYFNEVPYRVLRMEWKQPSSTLYGRQPLVDRETGITDSTKAGVSMDEMREALVYVGKEILDTIINTNNIQDPGNDDWYIQITSTNAGTPDNGFDCIELGRMCLADCRDTVYPFSTTIYARADECKSPKYPNISCYGVSNGLLTEDDDDVIIVLGVNHAITNVSSYASIAVYDAEYWWGVNAIGNDKMEDTVWNYVVPGEEPTTAIQASLPYLYAYEFRRNCSVVTNKNCLEVAYKVTIDGEGFIPLKDTVVLTERMYNNPLTHVGPDPNEVIMPIVIHMKRRNSTERKNN